ncbi:MAG: geranylgeranylglyceryl/heptaprenylglyceryl phosphate synthase, partial [Chryseotalea sp.]
MIYKSFLEKKAKGHKSVAVLIDPDKVEDGLRLQHLINLASENLVDYFFVGGSLITTTNLHEVVKQIKQSVNIPVVLFPGNTMQIE